MHPENTYPPTDEISLKDLIDRGKDYVDFLLKKWKTIVFISLLGGIIGVTYSFLKTPVYEASSTFMLEDGNSGSMPGYLALAGQFGIGGGTMNEEKLIKILKSRTVIISALMTEVEIDTLGKDRLANHYLEIYEWREQLEEYEDLKDFKFQHDDPSEFTFREDSVANRILFAINSENIFISEEEGIISLTISTVNEKFSKYLNEAILFETKQFYIRNTVQKEKESVETLEHRLDSVKVSLEISENKLAILKDAHIATIKAQGRKEEMKLTRDVSVLNVLYGEIIKNLEIAKYNLLTETPVIQVIDYPVLPLLKIKLSKIKALIGGMFLFGFLAVLYFLTRKIISHL